MTLDLSLRWQVIEGDCLDVMRALPDGCVDAVVTDPPYGFSHSSNWKDSAWRNQVIAGDDSTDSRDTVVAWASERDLPWLAFGSWKRNPPAGTRGVLIWDKGPASGMGDLSFPWKLSWEEVYVGGPRWSGHRDGGVIQGHTVVTWATKGRNHPNEKPVSLMRYLTSRLPANSLILDPFCGSGSTGVAAIQEGHRFLGIEREPAYVAIARRRIADAAAQGSLFDSGAA